MGKLDCVPRFLLFFTLSIGIVKDFNPITQCSEWQRDLCEFEAHLVQDSQSYTVRLCLKNKNKEAIVYEVIKP